MPDEPKAEFFFRLFRTRNRIRFILDDHFKPMGLTDATWRTLFYLEQTGNDVLQKELATIMGIEGPTLVRLLDKLEARGLIERRPSPSDRRGKCVNLTDDALELLDSMRHSTEVIRNEILQDASDEEIRACLDLFDRILARCDANIES